MEPLEPLVSRARDGNVDAFSVIVHRFQDMAVGYGYSLLHDFHQAEDAAQEAFFEAYRTLGNLRDPAAFPGWFRRIVFKQCDRITRRKTLPTVPLELAREPVAIQTDAVMTREIVDAMDRIPEHEREATLLFYISGYSLEEVALFLEVPVSTVKGRLHSARSRLRDMLAGAVENELRVRRPSRSETFANTVVELVRAARAGDGARVKELLQRDPRLLAARDPMGNTALIAAVNSGHDALAELLLDAGVAPDIHEASAIGDVERMTAWLDRSPALLDAYSAEGFPPLALAAHFGHADAVRLLLARGADVNRVARHRLQVTPLHAALFGRRLPIAILLIEHGADVNAARGGEGLPRAGWTALHYAAGDGATDLARTLLDHGANPETRDADGRTPCDVAIENNHAEMAELLRRRSTR